MRVTWFMVDDHFWGNPKRTAASPAALGLWVVAGSWCAQQMNEGNVPKHALAMLGGTPKLARALVETSLWVTTEAGWRFHDWDDYQLSKDDIEERRRLRAEAGARGGRAKARASKNLASATESPPRNASKTLASARASATENTPETASKSVAKSCPYPLTQRDLTKVKSLASQQDNAREEAPPKGPPVGPGWKHVRNLISDEHPKSVQTALAIQASTLLNSGSTDDDVRDALTLWLRKPSLGPGVLPSLVSEVIRNRNSANLPGTRRSTTDDRVAQVQALKNSPESARKALT